MANLSEIQLRTLKEIIEYGRNNMSDDDFHDALKLNNLPVKECYKQIAEWSVPKQCQGCKHICLYPTMPPCTSCKRVERMDRYDPE